jgi:hypothetical protein
MADFSYFDQFNEMEVDLTPYLESLSTPDYKYTLSNIQPIKTTIKNLFTKQEIILDYKKNIDAIIRYDINGDEFMENVAYKKLGSAEYWWVVAVFNDIREPFKQWPMTQQQIIDMAKNLYNTEMAFSYETYLTFITEHNDLKRQIILPKYETLKDIIWKYREAIK